MTALIARLFPHRRNGFQKSRWIVARVLLVGFVFWVASTVIVAYPAIVPSGASLSVLSEGDLAPRDIDAPRDDQFVSALRTAEQRQAAAAAIQPIYDTPDPAVARLQTARAREILAYIEDIRRDPYASPEQKVQDLEGISDLSLDMETSIALLALAPERWTQVQLQIVSVLERVMRDSIREADLPLIRRERVPLAVSLTFSTEEAAVIDDIASDLVRFNTRENLELTEEARAAAAAAIPPVTRSFISGERIVAARQRIDALHWEALQELGLTQVQENRLQVVLQAALANALILLLGTIYLWRWPQSHLRKNWPLLISLLSVTLLHLPFALILLNNNRIYAYPAASIALIFVGLLGMEGVFLSLLPLSLLLTLMAGGSLGVGVMFLAGGLAGALFIRRSARLSEYFLAGLLIAVVNVLVLVLFNLASGANTSLNQLTIFFAALNGMLAAFVALVALYVQTSFFNQPTSLKLSELARPNHPLLQRLLREAPGTYTHSLQVANLAEQAAQDIGADAELTQVASLYHDIGKILDPAFFIENQAEMGNPHDALADPYRSADILIDHVREGDKLAREERLPARIREFIREHHGTTLSDYFYRRACEQFPDQDVEVAAFRYPGPRPRSRETAILMLADSSEATTRARHPQTRQEVAEIVAEIFQARRVEGQLDVAPLTLKELRQIQDVFVDILQATFHPRIDYRPASPPEETADEPPTPPVVEETVTLPTIPAAENTPPPEEEDDVAPLAEVPPLRRSRRPAKPAEDAPAEDASENDHSPA